MTEETGNRARERDATRRADESSSANLRAIYTRIAKRYGVLADCDEIVDKARKTDKP